MVFKAETDSTGVELFVSDSTANGTFPIRLVGSTVASPLKIGISNVPWSGFKEFKNELYFTANFGGDGYELYKLKMNPVSIGATPKINLLDFYPNPANTALTIKMNGGTSNTKVEIVNMQGQTVFINTMDFASGEGKLDISNLSQGLYIIHLINEDNNSTSLRFMKD